MTRVVVVAVFMVVASSILAGALFVGTSTAAGSIMVNLGTEIFGIVITVAVVEWFFERRRLQDRARDLAWGVLHGVEQGVWMWQGGPRRMATDQLLGLVSAIGANDHMAPTTQAFFQNLGDRTSQILQREEAALNSIAGLEDALNDLTSLKGLGEENRKTELRMISEILETSATGLAKVLGQPDQRIPSALIRYRDPSIEAQERRHIEGRPLAEIAATGTAAQGRMTMGTA